ncbi:MAG: hypothetical protein RhofKO_32810 [Rhodothermales bacterium]
MRSLIAAFAVALLLISPMEVNAQVLTDTTFTWKAYNRTGQCEVQIFATAPDDDRTHTIVLKEVAGNDGPSIVEDARYLAEQVGREFNIDPANAYWVYQFGSFSYEGAEPGGKEVLLRATYRRTKSNRLAAPQWRVISRDDMDEYTDRLFR